MPNVMGVVGTACACVTERAFVMLGLHANHNASAEPVPHSAAATLRLKAWIG